MCVERVVCQCGQLVGIPIPMLEVQILNMTQLWKDILPTAGDSHGRESFALHGHFHDVAAGEAWLDQGCLGVPWVLQLGSDIIDIMQQSKNISQEYCRGVGTYHSSKIIWTIKTNIY